VKVIYFSHLNLALLSKTYLKNMPLFCDEYLVLVEIHHREQKRRGVSSIVLVLKDDNVQI